MTVRAVFFVCTVVMSTGILQVTAWFAPQFAELRRRCCSGGEEAFVCSLSRCRAWEARGGKTRAYFAKSADDRYIVKQLQASEKKSFQEIAPSYFRYLASCIRRGASTCLAKILGVYTVHTSDTVTPIPPTVESGFGVCSPGLTDKPVLLPMNLEGTTAP